MKKKFEILKNQGIRWTIYRTQYEFKKKIGLLEKKYKTEKFIDINSTNFILNDNFYNLFIIKNYDFKERILKDATQILNKKYSFFSNQVIQIPKINWHKNYFNGKKSSEKLHWSRISDLNSDFGDIKIIWELSRFTFAYKLAQAYFITKEERFSNEIWALFTDFYRENPPELGVNYKCSQEMSLRLFALIYAANLTKDSLSFKKIEPDYIKFLIQHIRHIYKHINFSVESVRNNHTISEAAALYIIGSVFKENKESVKWRKKGKEILEKEISWQIYEDGSYIQSSHNYHRLVLNVLTLVKIVADFNKDDFSDEFIKKVIKTSHFLLNHCNNQNGTVPNYGMNDGAYILPITTQKYSDYRPTLNALFAVYKKELVYNDIDTLEMVKWLGIDLQKLKNIKPNPKSEFYEDGGYLVSHKKNQKVTMRCTSYKHRPAQADMLHVDFWASGENILADAGTYSYNTTQELQLYFNGTKSHNSLYFNNKDQMQKGNRFIWYNWVKSKVMKCELNESVDLFKGTHFGYNPVNYTREIHHEENLLIIRDDIDKNGKLLPFQFYFLLGVKIKCFSKNKFFVELQNKELWSIEFIASEDFEIMKVEGKQSLYYNDWIERDALQLVFNPQSSKTELETIVRKEGVVR